MNRIDATFKKLKQNRQKAAIAFFTAGDPSLKVTREVLRFAEQAGVDLVEIGVPFSDPLADGPVIQASSFRALERGTSLADILRLVREERRKGLSIPIVIMTSFNPVLNFGVTKAIAEAKRAGVDGFIIPDLPYHEAGAVFSESKRLGLRLILMITPTTDRARRRELLRRANGFLYYVSLTGLTGERKRAHYPFKADVALIRRSTRVPVCVGFGISEPRQARDIAKFSDGIIVGSAIVRDLAEHSRTGLSAVSRRCIAGFVRGAKGK